MDKIKELQQELLEQCALIGPAKETLEDCLAQCGKLQLRRIAMGNDLEVPEKVNKEAMNVLRRTLKELIPLQFKRKLPYLLPEQRELLHTALAAKGTPVKETDFGSYSVLFGLGLIYMFRDEGQFYLAVPEEILAVMEEADMVPGAAPEDAWKRGDELWTYTLALLNLYGAYDTGWFAQVWNQHHKEKITAEQAEAYLESMWNLQFYYWYHDGFVIASYFQNEQLLDAFLDQAADIPYYMPTKRDISYYYEHDYDEDSPNYKKVEAFLEEKMARETDSKFELALVMGVIGYAGVLDLEELGVLEQLEGLGVVFTSPEEEKQFLALFAGMSENSRKWALCGWRPTDQY